MYSIDVSVLSDGPPAHCDAHGKDSNLGRPMTSQSQGEAADKDCPSHQIRWACDRTVMLFAQARPGSNNGIIPMIS